MSFSCTITPLISTARVEQEKKNTFAFFVSLMCVTEEEQSSNQLIINSFSY